VYVVIALLGLLLISAAALIVIALTRGEKRAARVMRAVGRRIPRVGADRMDAIGHELTDAMRRLTGDRRLLRNAAAWAAANWLLDAAALWCFVAALGRYAEPFELFAAYGIANVLAAIRSPGGVGGSSTRRRPPCWSASAWPGTSRRLGVLGWRLVNYWLPIPTGAIAYVTLQRPRRGHDQDASRRAPGNGEAPRDTGCRGG
jgi:uncharacterized membrane protein YbhN (UPF0104 family)